MKPIFIHYPYAINWEHQQLQTSIKGAETPEQSAQQYIKNIRFTMYKCALPNQVYT